MEEEDCSPGGSQATTDRWKYAISSRSQFHSPFCFYSAFGLGISYDQRLTPDAVVTDFEDPKFDLEAYLKMKFAETN